MQRFTRRSWLTVLAVLTVLTIGTATAPSAVAAATNPPLTKGQRIGAAIALRNQGATPQQIERMLNNPQLRNVLPTKVTRTVAPVQAARVVPQPGCRSQASHLNHYNRWGTLIYQFTVNKYWCWDGFRVTHTPDAGISHWINFNFRLAVWFHGVGERKNHHIAPGNGGFLGHHSAAEGNFGYCVAKYGCLMHVSVTALVTGWETGRADTNAWYN